MASLDIRWARLVATYCLILLYQILISVESSQVFRPRWCSEPAVVWSDRLAQSLRLTMGRRSNMDPKYSFCLAFFDTLYSCIPLFSFYLFRPLLAYVAQAAVQFFDTRYCSFKPVSYAVKRQQSLLTPMPPTLIKKHRPQ